MIIAGLLMFAFNAWAQDSPVVGYVKVVTGDATLAREGQSLAVGAGTPLHLGDRLRTASGASVGLTLKDSTLLSIGPDSELVVDAFLFAPASGQLALSARLLHGTLHFISGIIAKLKPEAVNIVTPTATIGVRGTRFVVKVSE
ncbi:FecR domain-containing protein [Azoarcus sp. L1K30]|nr:FecR domain-containing protein [Azoarcus sp. L1K30]